MDKITRVVLKENELNLNLTEGSSIINLLNRKVQEGYSKHDIKNLKRSTIEILRNCVPSQIRSRSLKPNTGIVIGKIQSGKTMSFTSLMALARDNNFKIAIIISGRTKLLLGQTTKRLKEELQKEDSLISVNKDCYESKSFLSTIKKRLERNKKNNKLYIIPVLKHQDHIGKIIKCFSNNALRESLKTNGIIIIDDEADQASLNTNARKNYRKNEYNESAIFGKINELKSTLPFHSFIQYTATPQANLLLSTINILSPDWKVILDPGENYTGGEQFFKKHTKIIQFIPTEGSYPETIDELKSIPDSLKESICEFLILASLMRIYEINEKASMLIHPTWRVNETDDKKGINTFSEWTKGWLETLENDLTEDYYKEFNKSYNKIKKEFKSHKNINSFPKIEDVCECIEEHVIDSLIESTRTIVGGSPETKEEFPWDSNEYHILIGGSLLDRGFTVENLIMTYMPRDSKGLNQADTIQQRCRFYGYRKSYLEFCRVYITSSMIDDYNSYNKSEKDIIDYLKTHTLNEFYDNGHTILMDTNLKPTNVSRIDNELNRAKVEKHNHLEPQTRHIDFNNNLISSLIDSKKPDEWKKLEAKEENMRTTGTKHRVSKISSDDLLSLYDNLKIHNDVDKPFINSLKRHLSNIKEKIKFCWLIHISPNFQREREIIPRGILSNENYKVSALFTGGKAKTYFFNDRDLLIKTENQSSIKFNYDNELVLQIHYIGAKENTADTVTIKGKKFYIPNLYIPEKLGQSFLSTGVKWN